MRSFDPSYSSMPPDGGPSVEEHWKNAYPYVPTSYVASSDGEIESRAHQVIVLGHAGHRTLPRRGRSGEKKAAGDDGGSSERESDSGGEERPRRGFSNQFEFIFCLLSFTCGIGKQKKSKQKEPIISFPGCFWRFPQMIFEYGGVFFVSYSISLLLIGIIMTNEIIRA